MTFSETPLSTASRSSTRPRRPAPDRGLRLVGGAAVVGVLHAGLAAMFDPGGPVWLLAAALAVVTGVVAAARSWLLAGHRHELAGVLGALWALLAAGTPGVWPVAALAAGLCALRAVGVGAAGRR
jgi:hypothetical protein